MAVVRVFVATGGTGFGNTSLYEIVADEREIGVNATQTNRCSCDVIRGEGVSIGNTTLVATAQVSFETNVQKNISLQVGQKNRLNNFFQIYIRHTFVVCL